MIDSEQIILCVIIVIGIGFILFGILFAFFIAFGDDSEDPAGYCNRTDYPYTILCSIQSREARSEAYDDFVEELLNRTKEWNNDHNAYGFVPTNNITELPFP